MKDLYLFNNGRLKRKDSTIYFLSEDGTKKVVPIEQVENLHIFSEMDFNTSFINLLNQKDVCIHFYNYYGYYSGSYIPRKKKVSGFVEIKQAEHVLNPERRLYIAQQFVYSAIHHILRNMRRHQEELKGLINEILEYKQQVSEAKDVPTLMGIEGKVRLTYYKGINAMIKNNDFYFTSRQKRPPSDPINAMISFGNSLIYTAVLSEIYKTQLNPTISFLHEPGSRRFSLSLDIAEIFKPLIMDNLIFSLINKRSIQKKHFEFIEEKICLLNEEGRKIFIKEFENRMRTTIKHRKLKRQTSYRFLIRLECYKLIKHFIGDEDYRALKAWW
ncbi:type I-B CRISPR-associated endonuclease Cas1b [Ureibacillus terrenus]|uniref:CRISPR-associated endonuclease Cas1 n=1 Tax=Ureibacillus terrenus TaxID=118246 RepID=A0A540V4Q2_9BACL|nr:type I-B CRISPR-associated endonuclease Cas1b [Ureibacillus terrenus]MED3660535.1 type I-B CRISPR-associated endonuclease Cas1b [Ureibacillus terrenus]MED3763904.1 type I-B CRISPR-associated endonuclease Cas1b [Ureibacillus terrenus]TQE91725.1 type I-B CRISPR-associated endonuclease Cas1 [Ureibacillus terrenus]